MSRVLSRLIGITRADDLLLSGRVVTADETAGWGLWNDVLPDGEAALSAAIDSARLLATSVGPRALSITKAQIARDIHRHDSAASVADSKQVLDEAMQTGEYREGIAALRAKRPPRF